MLYNFFYHIIIAFIGSAIILFYTDFETLKEYPYFQIQQDILEPSILWSLSPFINRSKNFISESLERFPQSDKIVCDLLSFGYNQSQADMNFPQREFKKCDNNALKFAEVIDK